MKNGKRQMNRRLLENACCAVLRVDYVETVDEFRSYSLALYAAMEWGEKVNEKVRMEKMKEQFRKFRQRKEQKRIMEMLRNEELQEDLLEEELLMLEEFEARRYAEEESVFIEESLYAREQQDFVNRLLDRYSGGELYSFQ